MSRKDQLFWFLSGVFIGTTSIVVLNKLKKSVNQQSIPIKSENECKSFPTELKEELLSRTKSFFGNKRFENIEKSFVIVVGLGGVGSHAANMLVRSGIGKIRLIDFDQVSLSSLNRHAVASLEDVGTSKSDTMKRKLSKICPWCVIESISEMFKMTYADQLLSGNPDYVLDCIDDINTKGELLAYCVKKDIKVLTSMGAGAKADPTKLRIAPITDCVNDPLASKIKWKLKKFGVQAENILSVFSIEKPTVDLLPLEDEQTVTPQDYGSVDYFRIRVMPVIGTSPSIFGQAMASYVLCVLAGIPYSPSGFDALSKKLKEKMRNFFRREEMDRFHNDEVEDLNDDDLEFIINTVWRARCAVTGKRFFGPTTMTLTRWNAELPPTLDNLVLLSNSHAQLLSKNGKTALEPEVVEKIERRLVWAKEAISHQWENVGGNNQIQYYLPSKIQLENRNRNNNTNSNSNDQRNLIITCFQYSIAILLGFSLSKLKHS